MKLLVRVFAFLFLSAQSLNAQMIPCVNGMAGNYPCNKVDLLSFVSVNDMGGNIGTTNPEANDIWGWTDPQTGKEYAIVGLKNGTSFLDITDPVNPVYLGRLPTATSNSAWRDMKVHNNHVFVVSEANGHGLQSFDLTNLRNVSNPPVTFSPLQTFNNIGVGDAHNIVGFTEIDHMVVVGGAGTGGASGGLIFVDVSNPANMVRTGDFSSDGYTHDAVCFIYQGPDTEHVGKEICIASNEDTQTIVDITNKSNPVQISRRGYVNDRYTHQGWITDDHKFLLFNDELDEYYNIVPRTRTHIMDISDLDNPVYLGFYEFGNESIDHNLYVKGQYSYQAHYRSGLRILNLKNLTGFPTSNISESAFFDTYPANNNHSFNSAWGVYPYFKSGVIIVSDIEQGLFILKPQNSLAHFVLESQKVPQSIFAGQDVIFNINLDAYYGYTDNVSLSVSGLPSGATASFGSNPVSSSGNTTLTISNTENLSPGNYSINIEGRGPGNNSIHDYSVAFTIVPSGRLYVDTNVSGSGDGSSWANALKQLWQALNAANPGDEIWVAQGTYNPTNGSNRGLSFDLVSNLKIYGGFIGNENSLGQRDWENNHTILSGDIGTISLTSDNSYHVLKAQNLIAPPTIDGFIIKNGNANGSGSNRDKGGGILLVDSELSLQNCTLELNNAINGGGVYLIESAIHFDNCLIQDNSATMEGRTIYLSDSTFDLESSEIIDSGSGNNSIYLEGTGSVFTIKGNVQLRQ